jgi:hypothetical protein
VMACPGIVAASCQQADLSLSVRPFTPSASSACLPPTARQASQSENEANSSVPVRRITGALVCRLSRIYSRPHSASFAIRFISLVNVNLSGVLPHEGMLPDGLLSFRFLSSLLSWFAGRGAPGPRRLSTFPQLTLRLAHQRTFAGRPESVLLRALLATP